MKILISSLAFISYSVFASTCPELSGEYKFLEGGHRNRSIVVEQSGCDFLRWRWTDLSTKIWFGHKTDGAAYQGAYNYGPKEIPATPEDDFFYRAQFLDGGISIRNFRAPQKICGASYSFGWTENPYCPMYELSIRYDEGAKSYIWVNTGSVKTPQGYSVDTFRLKKVR